MKQRSIIDRISQNKADLKDSISPYYRSIVTREKL